jgi:hypothetical protein
MQIDGNDEFGRFFILLPIVLAVSLGAYILFGPRPAPPPPNRFAFGCYSTPSGPHILLDAAGMHIRQKDYGSVGYHLERGKTGIALTAEAPINASLQGDRYQFGMDRRGIGRFLPFGEVKNGRRYGVFDEADLSQFSMIADDGVNLIYTRDRQSNCPAV